MLKVLIYIYIYINLFKPSTLKKHTFFEKKVIFFSKKVKSFPRKHHHTIGNLNLGIFMFSLFPYF